MPRDYLTDPARAPFRAAQRVAAIGEDLGRLEARPKGEVIWSEVIWGLRSDEVVLTPDGWLVYLSAGQHSLYGRRLRATAELMAELRRHG